jgi:hypothetical protein
MYVNILDFTGASLFASCEDNYVGADSVITLPAPASLIDWNYLRGQSPKALCRAATRPILSLKVASSPASSSWALHLTQLGSAAQWLGQAAFCAALVAIGAHRDQQ